MKPFCGCCIGSYRYQRKIRRKHATLSLLEVVEEEESTLYGGRLNCTYASSVRNKVSEGGGVVVQGRVGEISEELNRLKARLGE